MYADDTTLYFNLEDIDSVNMNENKLTVKVSKTKFMIFHNLAQGCTTVRAIAK